LTIKNSEKRTEGKIAVEFNMRDNENSFEESSDEISEDSQQE